MPKFRRCAVANRKLIWGKWSLGLKTQCDAVSTSRSSPEWRKREIEVVAGAREDGKFVSDGARLTEGFRGEWEGVREVMLLPFKGSSKNWSDGNASVNASDVTDLNMKMDETTIQLNVWGIEHAWNDGALMAQAHAERMTRSWPAWHGMGTARARSGAAWVQAHRKTVGVVNYGRWGTGTRGMALADRETVSRSRAKERKKERREIKREKEKRKSFLAQGKTNEMKLWDLHFVRNSNRNLNLNFDLGLNWREMNSKWEFWTQNLAEKLF